MSLLLDVLNARINNRIRLFPYGWGCPAVLERAGEWFARVVPIEIEWGSGQPFAGGVRRRGRFVSPYAQLGLPAESRMARLELILPQGWDHHTPVALQFPSTGDEGCHRARVAARAMLARGIGSVLLEVAFYGGRRPHDQVSTYLHRVSDLWLLGMSAWEEGRSLLDWLTRSGFTRLGVCGISMGGLLAGHVAALWPEPLAVSGLVCPHSAAVVYADSVLAAMVDWAALPGGRPRMRAVLDRTDIRHFPMPPRPDASTWLGARSDGYVPPESMGRMAARWPGSELSWMDGGHVEAVAWRGQRLAGLMDSAFERLVKIPEKGTTNFRPQV